jgi:hypothetical protein
MPEKTGLSQLHASNNVVVSLEFVSGTWSLHCGVGFSRRDHLLLRIRVHESSGGVDAPHLFKWDKYVPGRIENVNIRGTEEQRNRRKQRRGKEVELCGIFARIEPCLTLRCLLFKKFPAEVRGLGFF